MRDAYLLVFLIEIPRRMNSQIKLLNVYYRTEELIYRVHAFQTDVIKLEVLQ